MEPPLPCVSVMWLLPKIKLIGIIFLVLVFGGERGGGGGYKINEKKRVKERGDGYKINGEKRGKGKSKELRTRERAKAKR